MCLLRTRRNPVLRGIASVYIAILRGTPVLMLLLLLYYGIFARVGLKPVMVAVVTFGLNVSAHVAELLRSALEASDKGQAEAARTLGFGAFDTFRLINNIASRTMQPLLTISIGMLIYLALSYIVFGIFALTDYIKRKKRGEPA